MSGVYYELTVAPAADRINNSERAAAQKET
jgi:hypothetical protein